MGDSLQRIAGGDNPFLGKEPKAVGDHRDGAQTGAGALASVEILNPNIPELFAKEEQKLHRKNSPRIQNLAASLNYQLVSQPMTCAASFSGAS
jgi:hypothetical protein